VLSGVSYGRSGEREKQIMLDDKFLNNHYGNILIAEDSPTQAEQLSHTLERCGYSVSVAMNGRDALALASERKPSMLITDIEMPEMDGYLLCTTIKADDSLKDIPVILLTHLSDPEDVIRGLECGADNFIMKPYNEENLIARIRHILLNVQLRSSEKVRIGVEIFFRGRKYYITSERQQILDLLLSTYETAVLKNQELVDAQEELVVMNERLEEMVNERTSALTAEIAERKLMEEALRESETRFRQTFEQMPIGAAIVSQEYRFVRVNQAMCRITGYPEEEMTSMMFHDITHPDDKSEDLRKVKQLASGELDQYRVDRQYLRKDGVVIWVDLSVSMLKDTHRRPLYFLFMVQDITEHRIAMEALKERERHQNALLNGIPDMAWLKDREGRYIAVNEPFARTVGMCPNEIKGKTDNEIWLEKMAENFRAGDMAVLESGRVTQVEEVMVDAEMNSICVETIRNPIYNDMREVIGTTGIARDITERNSLENQLRQAQKLEAVGTLTGGIAHDFNNILTAIIGYAGIIEMSLDGNSPLLSNVKGILAASDRGAALTKSLLAFSRKRTIDPRAVSMNVIIADACDLLSRLFQEDIELRTSLTGDPVIVMADPGQMEQVLMNLTTNARDAMAGKGRISISTELVNINDEFVVAHGFGSPGRYVLVSFSDTGLGMDESTRQRIFEPFFTTKEVGKGTGLGLSVIYGIIKQHHGYIHCSSEPGRGTTFRMYLPAIDSALEQQETGSLPLPSGGSETVLLGEDDPAIRNAFRNLLERFGYRVIEAADGEEALFMFVENMDEIRLVVLDAIMPNKSGTDAYLEIQAMRPDLKAIFMSGYTEEFFTLEGISPERVSLLTKPVSPILLLTTIRNILDS
jgi:two-component system cell cycle sensor histidine kinase/response regulator CckA